MFVNFKGSTLGLLRWQWKPALIFVAFPLAVVAFDVKAHLAWLELPAMPLAVIGGAIGIFVSFRTNSGYDRWWEGRKLWGRMVNTSRHWTTQVLMYVRPPEPEGPSAEHDPLTEERATLVRRHAAYVHVLRCLLREQDPFADERVLDCLPDEDLEVLKAESNLTHALLQRQGDAIARLARAEVIDPFMLQSMDESIRHLLDIQGGCERIKKTPFPPGYGFLATRLIQAYAFLLPFGLVEGLSWFAIPITFLVCMGFTLISEVGRTLENPFTMFWPALALSALSTTIEVNIRQRIGDTALPAIPKPNERGVLM